MKKVAPELESLMWTLAEEENERAIDEFGTRHPELRTELLHRIAMVKGLRGEKKRAAEPAKAIPRFVPKEPKSNGPVYIVGALVLAAVCALTFAVTMVTAKHPFRPPTDPAIPNNPPQVIVSPPISSNPPVTYGNTHEQPPAQTRDEEPALKQGTLRIKGVPLQTVFDMISEVCHIQIDAAPGMPNPDVMVDYQNMNAMEMLRDLGKQYRFTPLDQHNGSILVVPAVDPNDHSMTSDPTGGDRNRRIGG